MSQYVKIDMKNDGPLVPLRKPFIEKHKKELWKELYGHYIESNM
jgi:hypothetical protein